MNLFSDEVDIHPVHAVEVLSHEDWKLLAEHVDDREDIAEGEVDHDQEEGAVDVHDSVLVQLLVQVDDSKQQSQDNGLDELDIGQLRVPRKSLKNHT